MSGHITSQYQSLFCYACLTFKFNIHYLVSLNIFISRIIQKVKINVILLRLTLTKFICYFDRQMFILFQIVANIMRSKNNCKSQHFHHQSHKNKMNSSLHSLNLLSKFVDKYTSSFQAYSTYPTNAEKKGETSSKSIELIQSINKFLEKMRIEQEFLLSQKDKMDCLFQSLEVVKKLTVVSNKNNIETRSKRLSQADQQNSLKRKEMLAINNMVELILTKILPQKRNIDTINSLVTVIIQNLSEYKYDNDQQFQDKKMIKKAFKKNSKDKIHVQIQLLSGVKVDLLWYLIFRITQKNLEQIQKLHQYQCTNRQASLAETYQKYVKQYVKQIIKIVIHGFSETSLTKDLIKVVIKNVGQMQLPIIAFFLKQLHVIIHEKFRIYYQSCRKNNKLTSISSKQLFSLDSIVTWFDLINYIANNISLYESSKKIIATNGLCSYCGVNLRQSYKPLYQQIQLKINIYENLIIKICQNCCNLVNCEPSDELNIKIFGPLILSRFWNVEFGQPRLIKVKYALRGILGYHDLKIYTKKNKNMRADPKILINDKIAMNNNEQMVQKTLLQQIYNMVLFFHSNLSIKDILVSLFNIMITFFNRGDNKVRQKCIKVFDKTYIHAFLFNYEHIPHKCRSQMIEIGFKIISCLQKRIKDNCSQVSIASLQCLTNIFLCCNLSQQLKNTIYESLCQSIIQQDTIIYHKKALSFIEKIIDKTYKPIINDQLSVIVRLNLLMKYLRCLEILAEKYFQQEQKQTVSIGELISNNMHKIFQAIHDLQSLIDQSQAESVLNEINKYSLLSTFNLIKVNSLDNIISNLVLSLIASAQLNKTILITLPEITYEVVVNMINITKIPNCDERVLLNIERNITSLIEIVYHDVISLKQQICFQKKRRETFRKFNIKSNIQILSKQINSASFLYFMIQNNYKNNQLSNVCLAKILCKLLECINLNQLIHQRKQLINYIMVWVRCKKNISHTLLNPIVGSYRLLGQLKNLSETLLDSIKCGGYNDLFPYVHLLVHLKMFLGPSDQPLINQIALRYERYSYITFQKYKKELQIYLNQSEGSDFELDKCYHVLNRCCLITTLIVTKYEQYVLIHNKFLNFYEKYLVGLAIDESIARPIVGNSQDESVETTGIFSRMYSFTLSVLQSTGDDAVRNKQIKVLSNKLLTALSYYWEIHSNIIFADINLLKILDKTNSQSFQAITMTKCLYQMFQSMLPTTNIQILSFIRSQFSKGLLFLVYNVGHDCLFMNSCFKIIFQMLKSGMEGLYTYNKYIYYGLIHQSKQVNKIATKIIRQIYTRQSSERIIFVNLRQSLELIFQAIFKLNQKIPFQQITLTQQQKQSFSLLSQITNRNNKVYLAKQKKQIRMKITFAKKIGNLISSEQVLISSQPVFFTMLLKILKTQKVFDYCELSELLFCLNSIISNNQMKVENLIESIKVDKLQKNEDELALDINYLISFRQVLSCVTYLAQYKQVSNQIKYYQDCLQNNQVPYVKLQQRILVTNLKQKKSFEDKISILQQQINAFLTIMLQGVQVINITGQSNSRSTTNSTALTKKQRNKDLMQPIREKRTRANKQSVSLDKIYQISSLAEQTEVKDNQYRTKLRKKEKKQYSQQIEK